MSETDLIDDAARLREIVDTADLYDNPDAVVDDYVEYEQRAQSDLAELRACIETLSEELARMAEPLNAGQGLSAELVKHMCELFTQIDILKASLSRNATTVAILRPEVDRALPHTSGGVFAGFQDRL